MALLDRFRSEPVYNTRAVVQQTGVPADTIRAWERRYGLPRPSRTAGNQRLYSERDIATVSWLRRQTGGGLTISQAVALFRSQSIDDEIRLTAVSGAMAGTPSDDVLSAEANRSGLLRFRSEMVAALVAFDAVRADGALNEALALLLVEDVCLSVLHDAAIEVNERRRRGEIGEGQQRFAINYVFRKLASLYNASHSGIGGTAVVAACVEGERNEIGLLLTSIFLARRGFQSVYLGSDVSVDALIDVVCTVRPRLAILSASSEDAVGVLEATIQELRTVGNSRLAGLRLAVGYGGEIFVRRPELQVRIGGTYLGRSAAEIVGSVEGLLASSVSSAG